MSIMTCRSNGIRLWLGPESSIIYWDPSGCSMDHRPTNVIFTEECGMCFEV